MSRLPIVGHRAEWRPAQAPADCGGYRWRVEIAGWGVLLVGLDDAQADATRMAPHELDSRVAGALQRYADTRLKPDIPALDQLGDWPSPVALHADHFTA